MHISYYQHLLLQFFCVLAPGPLQSWVWFCLEFSAWQPSPCLSLSPAPPLSTHIAATAHRQGNPARWQADMNIAHDQTIIPYKQGLTTISELSVFLLKFDRQILIFFMHFYDKWWLSQVGDIHTTEDPQEHYYNTHHITMKQLPVDYQRGIYLIIGCSQPVFFVLFFN